MMTESKKTQLNDSRFPTDHILSRLYRFLRIFNDLLLIPMFFLIVQEIEKGEFFWMSPSNQDLMLNMLFFTEWSLGGYLAVNRKAYSCQLMKILDLISCVPFSTLTQGVRLARLARGVKVIRLISRAKRYRSVGEEMVRTLSLVIATVFAGAYSFVVVESNHPSANSTGHALLWSLVIVSTIGYGDVVPETWMGRLISAPLIIVGVGVVGYIAGFMSTLLTSFTVQVEEALVTEIEDWLKGLDQKMNRLLALQGAGRSPSNGSMNNTESVVDS